MTGKPKQPPASAQSEPQQPIPPPPPQQSSSNRTAELQAKCDEYLAGWQRARADYQNLQKETERRITEIIQYSNEEFIRELLPIIDHFTYAFNGVPTEERSKPWVKGIEHIQTNVLKILESHGVQRIATVGTAFNPELHESVAEVGPEEKEPLGGLGGATGTSGTVAEEVAAGFTLHGKVIQHAKVKVIK